MFRWVGKRNGRTKEADHNISSIYTAGVIKTVPKPRDATDICKDPLKAVTDSQLKVLDPTGERKALFNKRNREGVKVGDILRVTFKNGDPFNGVCLNIRARGVDTAFLLRNHLTKVSAEMWVKVFSPNVQSVEIVQRTEKRKRRARLTYMRYGVAIHFDCAV